MALSLEVKDLRIHPDRSVHFLQSPRPHPIYGKKKTDGELTALPRRYTIVAFNVSDKNNDNVKIYMKTNNVNILEITTLRG